MSTLCLRSSVREGANHLCATGTLREPLSYVYRSWRDLGYAVGALSAGIIADTLGISWAIETVGTLTFLSGALVALALDEKQRR